MIHNTKYIILAILLFGFCFAGAVFAAPGEWASGKFGSAYDFNGNGYVVAGNIGSGLKTISFWVKADSASDQKIMDIDATDCIEITSSNIIATSFPGTTTIYIDGVVASAIDTAWHHIVITDTTGVNASAVDLGRKGADYFDGKLDEVRFYDYIRLAEEIRLDYNAGFAAHIGGTYDMTRGLVGYWTFDEGSQTDVPNHAPGTAGRNNGTWGGTGDHVDCTDIPPGQSGCAGTFDPSHSDYVNCGNDSSLDITDAITIEAWVKFSSWTADYFEAVAWKGESKDNKYYSMEGRYNNEYMTFRIKNSSGSEASVGELTAYMGTGIWYYVVGTYDSSLPSENLKIFVDGVLSDTNDLTGDIKQTSNPLYIGGGDSNYFDGSIDEVRIYNRALSADEIRYHYNRGAPVAHWKFNEGSGTTAYDESWNNNDGTLVNDTHYVTGNYGTALSFDGAGDYVNCYDQATQVFTRTKKPPMWQFWRIPTWNGYLNYHPMDIIANPTTLSSHFLWIT